ncbi:PilW family protein [Chromobacterium paludis]|uniref:PilW family protein n=1 Tax=Chromobacterium paludis TaxID=2605945 RepID=UPI00143D2C50|nr:hypothetical protein [Chromobacterium paludis]
MSGSCVPSRQRGSLLLGMLLATALGALVTAWALSSLAQADQSARSAARMLERRQQAAWALRLLARDVARHRRFGCVSQLWTAQDFADGHWTLSLPGRHLAHGQLALDAQHKLSSMALLPEAQAGAAAWPQSVLSSCAGMVALTAASAQWLGGSGSPSLQLTPPLLVQATDQAEGLHAPSLQLWLPLERHYQLSGGRLRVWERLGGLSAGEPRVLLDGVAGIKLLLQVRAGCADGDGWRWLAPSALTAETAKRVGGARLELAWRPRADQATAEVLSREQALTPLGCGGET